MIVSGFDWDSGNWPKCGKHGISKNEIEHIFLNEPSIYPDLKHSANERRFLAIGKSESGRYIFAAFTVRYKDSKPYIRTISARYMHQKEVDNYEKG